MSKLHTIEVSDFDLNMILMSLESRVFAAKKDTKATPEWYKEAMGEGVLEELRAQAQTIVNIYQPVLVSVEKEYQKIHGQPYVRVILKD